jgi:hypothetical protein
MLTSEIELAGLRRLTKIVVDFNQKIHTPRMEDLLSENDDD